MKYTLKDIEVARSKFLEAKAIEETMRAWDVDFNKQCIKVNRLRSTWLKIKGLYFNGNN